MSDHEVQEGEVIFNPQELTKTRQVDAVEQGREFYTVDKELNPILAGWTQLIDFDNSKAKGLIFIENGTQKQYSLGNPSRKQTNHHIVHHNEVLDPIQRSGFELANIVHSRGGSSVFALFRHPDLTMMDNTQWDHEAYTWHGNSVGDDGNLHLSIAAWLSPQIGKSLRLAIGFFRNICSNGLVSSILGLGHLRLTHNQFTLPKIEALTDKATTALDTFELQTFSPKVLEWPLEMLDLYQRDEEAAIAGLPAFAQTPFNAALASQPGYVQDGLLYQMNLALGANHDLSTLDVLNMLTNVSNEADNDNLYFRLESISESFVRLLEVSAFRSNIDFPSNIVTNVNLR